MKNLYDINDWLKIKEHQKLGEILMQSGKINLIHLGMALDIQRFEAIPIGEILLNMKIVSRDDIEQALILQGKLILLNIKNIPREDLAQALRSQEETDENNENEGEK
jgi:hypothetical protein